MGLKLHYKNKNKSKIKNQLCFAIVTWNYSIHYKYEDLETKEDKTTEQNRAEQSGILMKYSTWISYLHSTSK